ncbi:MAG: hypothetical protein AB8B39_01350 [Prochlorococcus sp.]
MEHVESSLLVRAELSVLLFAILEFVLENASDHKGDQAELDDVGDDQAY